MKENLSPKAKTIIQCVNRNKRPFIIAIDGNSASGKSRLAEELKEALSSSIIHMDDFFLRPEQKSEKRLKEIGGNIDYERFIDEVIKPLENGQPFSYGIYDCSSQTIHGTREIHGDIIVVEGVYSLHPIFGKYHDLSIFLHVSPFCQACRIRKRDGKEKYLRYKEEWIPKEDAYFEEFMVKDKADIVMKG